MNKYIGDFVDDESFRDLPQYSIDIIIGRRNLNLTQKDLAKLLDVPKVTVCSWEQGISIPSKPNYLELKKLLLTIRGIKYEK